MIEKFFVRTVWAVLFVEIFLAYAVWARTDIGNYDVKVVHYQMHTQYCPYCGEYLGKGDE